MSIAVAHVAGFVAVVARDAFESEDALWRRAWHVARALARGEGPPERLHTDARLAACAAAYGVEYAAREPPPEPPEREPRSP
jgi:hypothetical protein